MSLSHAASVMSQAAAPRSATRHAGRRRSAGGVVSLLLCGALLAVFFLLLQTGTALAWNGYTAKYDWSGSGIPSDPWVISSAEQLKGLANKVNTGTTYSGKYFKLGADIDLQSYVWVPIGGACALDTSGDHPVPSGYHFDGTFDGKNHTISGINVSNPGTGTGAYGLFGYVGSGGVLANLNLAGSLNMGTSKIYEIGSAVGYCQGSLFNVHSAMTVSMNDSSYTAEMCGGVAGAVDNTSSSQTTYVRYCSNTGSVTGRGRIGGIVGAVYCASNGGVVVDQCYNTGDITSTYSLTKIFTGGIVGYCRGYITNCYNWGNLATNNGHYLTGLVGILQGANPTASMSNCYSTAAFASGHYDPGWDRWLFGSVDYTSAVHINNCFWLPSLANSDLTQPYDPSGSWGTQTNVSAVTAAQLEGTADMTGCDTNYPGQSSPYYAAGDNPTGVFSGSIVGNYLGAADPDNAYGSYGFAYAASGGYPVLEWQLISGFMIDPASGVPAPATTYWVTATVSGGNGTATASPVSVATGGSSTVTLAPATGYWVDTITDNGVDVSGSVSGNVYTISDVAEDHTVVVAYTNGLRTLTYTAGAHGSITGSSTQTVANGADGAAVTAVADSGYHFAAWADGSTANPRTDTNVTSDLTEGAIFLPDDATTIRAWDHFTIAVLPDTQYYTASYPAIFDAQTQWIADHAKADNIVFVAHLGDSVNAYNSASGWKNAHDAMAIVRAAGIPYSVALGNHDLNFATHDVSYFDATFPYTAFGSYPWYGDHYPTTSNTSSYELFSAMGQKFIVLNLVCDPTLLAAASDWANAALSEYSDRKAIVVTHGYIDTSGAYLDSDSVSGLGVWDDVVRLHSNVVAVLCGHYSGEYEGTATGTNGNTVYNLLTDYQDEANGGDGWLRLYEFYPLQNEVKAVTYSPWLASPNQYQTDANSQFELTLQQDSHAATFTSDGTTCATEVTATGTQVAAPDDPTKSSCTFAGWYEDAACTSAASFPYTVSADVTLYARWTRSLSLASGWNLVAAGSATGFPGTIFGWNGSSYVSTATPTAWQGYWCKTSSAQTVSMSTACGPHTGTLASGWNLIGNPMSSTATLTLPSGRVAFVYDPAARSYVSTNTLAPGQGAWVKGSVGETVGLAAQ